MKAMLLDRVVSMADEHKPLRYADVATPEAQEDEIIVKVTACGVCHTELDEIEGRTAPPGLPIIPGHQVVGKVEERGPKAKVFEPGDRVGIGWIFSSCGKCEYCLRGFENLCADFKGTGRDANGGYAEYMKVGERFAYKIPAGLTDTEAAPLLCAGGVGYRALRLTGLKNGEILGLTGFGGSGHIVLKVVKALYPDSPIFVFARSEAERLFAMELGAYWAGDTDDEPPEKADAIIDTTPVWRPVVEALYRLKPGGRLVINAIRKENYDKDILVKTLEYESHLWMEKEIKTVANVCRKDIEEFLNVAEKAEIKPEVTLFALENANEALMELKTGKTRGAKVLISEK